MIDFAKARRTMVDTQLRASDVTDKRVLEAFLDVPREDFVSRGERELAYLDRAIPVGGNPPRSLMPAMVLARLIQAAGLAPSDTVLVIGAATGYGAAVLSRIVARVVALEADGAFSSPSESAVEAVSGPLQGGWAPRAPYDAILLEGSIEDVPTALADQLVEGGRLVAVVGRGRSARATVFVRTTSGLSGRDVFDAAIAPLPGFARPPAFAF